MNDEMVPATEAEGRSLDLVQRLIVSMLIGGNVAKLVGLLCYYLAARGRYELPYDSVVGLWVMSGVLGLAGTIALLKLTRRPVLHPALVLAVLPTAIAWYWVLGS